MIYRCSIQTVKFHVRCFIEKKMFAVFLCLFSIFLYFGSLDPSRSGVFIQLIYPLHLCLPLFLLHSHDFHSSITLFHPFLSIGVVFIWVLLSVLTHNLPITLLSHSSCLIVVCWTSAFPLFSGSSPFCQYLST